MLPENYWVRLQPYSNVSVMVELQKSDIELACKSDMEAEWPKGIETRLEGWQADCLPVAGRKAG